MKLYTYCHRDRNLQMSQIKVTFMRSTNISRHHHSDEHLPIPSRWWESWPSSAIINANIFFSRVGISKNSSPSFKDVDYLSAIPKAIRSTFVPTRPQNFMPQSQIIMIWSWASFCLPSLFCWTVIQNIRNIPFLKEAYSSKPKVNS